MQKIIEPIASLEVVDERLDRYTSAHEDGRAAQDLWVDFNNGRHGGHGIILAHHSISDPDFIHVWRTPWAVPTLQSTTVRLLGRGAFDGPDHSRRQASTTIQQWRRDTNRSTGLLLYPRFLLRAHAPDYLLQTSLLEPRGLLAFVLLLVSDGASVNGRVPRVVFRDIPVPGYLSIVVAVQNSECEVGHCG